MASWRRPGPLVLLLVLQVLLAGAQEQEQEQEDRYEDHDIITTPVSIILVMKY